MFEERFELACMSLEKSVPAFVQQVLERSVPFRSILFPGEIGKSSSSKRSPLFLSDAMASGVT